MVNLQWKPDSKCVLPTVAAMKQWSELQWHGWLSNRADQRWKINPLQQYETYCFVKLWNPVSALQLHLKFQSLLDILL